MSARAATAFLVAALAAWLCACAPFAAIAVSRSGQSSGPLRIHLASVRDYPGAPGSGARIRAELDKRLRQAGFPLVDYGADAMALVALSDYLPDKPEESVFYASPAPESDVISWSSARVALTARLVDIKTGRVLWAASSLSHPDAFEASLDYTYHMTTDAAVSQACDELVAAVSRRLKRRR